MFSDIYAIMQLYPRSISETRGLQTGILDLSLPLTIGEPGHVTLPHAISYLSFLSKCLRRDSLCEHSFVSYAFSGILGF